MCNKNNTIQTAEEILNKYAPNSNPSYYHEPHMIHAMEEYADQFRTPSPDAEQVAKLCERYAEDHEQTFQLLSDQIGVPAAIIREWALIDYKRGLQAQSGVQGHGGDSDLERLVSMVCDQFNAPFEGREEFCKKTVAYWREKPPASPLPKEQDEPPMWKEFKEWNISVIKPSRMTENERYQYFMENVAAPQAKKEGEA